MTATVPTQVPIDVHDMVVVHRVFRRELVALPTLIRAVPDGDVDRAGTVVAHVHLVLTGLQIHHTGEDAVLWPLLHERTDADALVVAMAAQHARIHLGIEAAATEVDAWAANGTAAAGERLTATLDELREHLVEHLDAEERDVLPLAAAHLTAAEWDSVGAHGRESMTRTQLPLMFGAILEDADADERASIYAAVPAPIRLLLKTVGARQYRRYITRVPRGRLRVARTYTMGARAEGVADTRERIVAAATKLFLEQMYDDVTLAGIAKAAGVSHQTVLNHFGSKRGLVAPVAEVLGQATATARAARPGDARSAIHALVGDYEQMGDANVRWVAASERFTELMPVLDGARASHQQWLRDMFGDELPAGTAARKRAVNALHAATDVSTWKLLRRELYLSRAETERIIVDLVQGVLRGGDR